MGSPRRRALSSCLAVTAVLASGAPTQARGPGLPWGNVTSRNWAGYAATAAGGSYSRVTAVWSQPAVRCSSGDSGALFWVGIDGYTSGTVEQVGTLVSCAGGVATYATWWQMYPAGQQVIGTSVRPHDVITATVQRDESLYTLTVDDKTHPANSFSVTQSCATCADTSAEWLVERPPDEGGFLPLSDFRHMVFTHARATSSKADGTILRFPHDIVTMVNDNGDELVTVSGLSKGGSSFRDTWRQAG